MATYKKNVIALLAILLTAQRFLYAVTQKPVLSNKHHMLPEKLAITGENISKNLSGMDFRAEILPQDLSGYNLTNANFTGQHFTYTNFTNAQLVGAILKNTTCDYQQYFQKNVKVKQLNGGHWYLDNLLKDLRNIAKIYPVISKNRKKAQLLQIASGLAHLPHYQDIEFYIQFEYWSCKLLLLKKKLGSLGRFFLCSMHNNLTYSVSNYCWKSSYPIQFEGQKAMKVASLWCSLATKFFLPSALAPLIQNYLVEPPEAIHANFDRYLQVFQEGLYNYNASSKSNWGYNFYKETIKGNIQGLAQIYPQLSSQALKKEVIYIAYKLSQSYKAQYWHLMLHYLTCQNKLIQLKSFLERSVGKDIYYNVGSFFILNQDKSHSKPKRYILQTPKFI